MGGGGGVGWGLSLSLGVLSCENWGSGVLIKKKKKFGP